VQRLMMYIFLVAMIITSLLVAAPLFIDNDKYQEKLLVYIEKSLGVRPKIKGSFEVTFFPVPTVTAKQLYIENAKEASNNYIIQIESIVSKIYFTDILAGNFKVRDIQFIRPVFEFENLGVEQNNETGATLNKNNWSFLIDGFKNRTVSDSEKFPDRVSITNATFSYSKDLNKKSIDYFNVEITADSFKGPFSLKGGFLSSDNTVTFEGGVDSFTEGAKVGLLIKTDAAQVNLDGVFKDGDVPRMEGGINLSSNNIGHIMGVFFQNKSYFTKITSKEELKVSGRFVFSKDTFEIQDVLIDSDSFKGTMNMGVDFNIGDKSKSVNWRVLADIDKIDIDNLFKQKKSEQAQDDLSIDYYAYSVNTASLADFKFDIPQSLTLSMDVTVDDIIYNQKISNVRAIMDIVNGHAEVNSLSADLPGNSRAVLRGKIKHNGTRPLFEGELEFGGSNFRDFMNWIDDYYSFVPEDLMKEFLFTAKLRVTPQHIDVTDLSFSFDQSLFSGGISLRPLKTIPIISASINIDRMDLDKYHIDKKIFEEIGRFVDGADEVLLERTWLAKLQNRLNITIDAKDIVFNDHYITNFSTAGIITRNNFNLQRFFIDSEVAKLKLNMYADIESRDAPEIKFNFLAKDLDTKLFIPKESYNSEKKYTWSNKPINFLGLANLYGEYKIAINNLKHKNLEMSNVNIEAKSINKMRPEVLTFDKFQFDIYQGRGTIQGQMGVSIKAPTVAVNVFLEGVELNPLLKVFKEDIETTGQLFFRASFSSKGYSFAEWIKELSVRDGTDAKLSLQQVKFKGFDLDAIINGAKRLFSFIDMQKVIEKALVSGETTFDWMEGDLVFKNGILGVKDFKYSSDNAKGEIDANISLFSFDTKARTNIYFQPDRKKVVVLPIEMKGNILELYKDKQIDTRDLEIYITDKATTR